MVLERVERLFLVLCSFLYFLFSMCLKPGGMFEQDACGADLVMVDIDVNIDELDRKEGELVS